MRAALAQAAVMYGIAFILSMFVAGLITLLSRLLRRLNSGS